MPTRGQQAPAAYPIRFTPRGLTDALDATDKFPGACLALTDLVFDQSNPEVMLARPGVGTGITDFSSFSGAGAISVHVTFGNKTFGMISSTLNAGKDQPFCYDHAAAAFIAISGIVVGNSPTTQATTGAWTPPTMAVVGTNIYVTHPGFAGGATKFGVIDISTPASPVWSATDTTTNNLTATPTAVANFGNRAYFAVGNTLKYTDVLSIVRTNSTQSLTLGDTAAITALSGLPIQTTSSGVIQALLAFKDFQVWQVTGDLALSNLAQNFLSLTIGTSAPRSVALSPNGVYFHSISGPYKVSLSGVVGPVTYDQNINDPDIVAPFQAATTPSRICAGYSANVYRICMETVVRGSQAFRDYWFDERKRRWTGPHSFAYDCASQLGNYFVLVSNTNTAKLFKSQVVPDSTSSYSDNGTAITSSMQTSTMPKTGRMTEKQVIESTQELSAASAATTYNITAQDEQGNTLNSCSLAINPSGKVWNGFVWGDGTTYTSSVNIPHVYNVPWTGPLVFKKFSLLISALATAGLSIGTHFSRYADAGYTNSRNP